MKIRQSTIDRVVEETFCDVGKYRYILEYGYGGWAYIKRREKSRLDTLPKYGPAWETVATFDPNADAWVISN